MVWMFIATNLQKIAIQISLLLTPRWAKPLGPGEPWKKREREKWKVFFCTHRANFLTFKHVNASQGFSWKTLCLVFVLNQLQIDHVERNVHYSLEAQVGPLAPCLLAPPQGPAPPVAKRMILVIHINKRCFCFFKLLPYLSVKSRQEEIALNG